MEAVRELAAALLPQTPQLSAEATDHLFAVIPVLAKSDDPEPRGHRLRARPRQARNRRGSATALLPRGPRLAMGSLVARAARARHRLAAAARGARRELGVHVRVRRSHLGHARRPVR